MKKIESKITFSPKALTSIYVLASLLFYFNCKEESDIPVTETSPKEEKVSTEKKSNSDSKTLIGKTLHCIGEMGFPEKLEFKEKKATIKMGEDQPTEYTASYNGNIIKLGDDITYYFYDKYFPDGSEAMEDEFLLGMTPGDLTPDDLLCKIFVSEEEYNNDIEKYIKEMEEGVQ